MAILKQWTGIALLTVAALGVSVFLAFAILGLALFISGVIQEIGDPIDDAVKDEVDDGIR